LTTEIEQSVDAREKVEAAVGQFNAQRDRIKPAFLLSLAREMQTTRVDANSALEAFAAWQATETRAAQQGEALRQLLAMFKERVEQFKSRSGDEALAALRRIIERLAAERDMPGADANAINKRIEKLQAEVEALCAPSAAPPREPKVTSNPPQKSSKGKDRPRPGIEK
jgi:predicted house-cleaning noncanonical NTP pyrophosphatase (MazG superfamily)